MERTANHKRPKIDRRIRDDYRRRVRKINLANGRNRRNVCRPSGSWRRSGIHTPCSHSLVLTATAADAPLQPLPRASRGVSLVTYKLSVCKV